MKNRPKRPQFVMTVAENGADFTFKSACHAEQVLRGLVHSGYTVTIKEVFVEMTDEEMKENGYYAPVPAPQLECGSGY